MRAQSPTAQTSSVPRTRRVRSTGTAPRPDGDDAVGAGQRHRAGAGPGGPDQGAGRHPLAVAEVDPVGVGAGHRDPEAQLDPAGDQLVAGVAGQPVAQLGQDALARVDQHEAGLAGADAGK